MKNQLSARIVLILLLAIPLTSCATTANGKHVYFYERPAVGFTVEEEVVTKVDLLKQNSLNLEAQDGAVKIIQWDRDYLQVVEKGRLTGPAATENLKTLLLSSKCKVENTTYEIKIEKEPNEDLKSLYRRTDDIELMVPKALKRIHISAKSGALVMTGFDDLTSVDLTLKKGYIKVDQCKMSKIDIAINDGDLDITGINGSGSYKCGRGNMKLKDITGAIELKSVSGNTYIENAEGKLNGDISAGSITVKDSRLKTESILYASNGDIQADLEGLDSAGKYTIKTAYGSIRLYMPEKIGWSLLARSTGGRIVDNLELTSGELEIAPSGEIYGDVGGGGPMIDVYVDRGDIFLSKGGSE